MAVIVGFPEKDYLTVSVELESYVARPFSIVIN